VVGTIVVVALMATFVLAPISRTPLSAMRLETLGRLAVAGIPAAVGLYARRVVRFERFGELLIASAVLWLAVTFSLTNQPLVYSIGRVADWLGWAAILYVVLVFPEGLLNNQIDRALARMTGLLLAGLYLPTALLVDHYPTPGVWVTCSASCPHNAFMVLSREPAVIGQVVVPAREVLTVLLFLAVVVRLFGRVAAASRIWRMTVTPVLGVASAGIALAAGALVLRRLAPGSPVVAYARWLVAFTLPAMSLAFLAGLMRWHMYVGASLRRFAALVGSRTDAEAVRAGLADAFEDPGLSMSTRSPVAAGPLPMGVP
jgi:hypothetical protein